MMSETLLLPKSAQIRITAEEVTSGLELAERIFQAVQGAIRPETPRRATEFYSQILLCDLQGLLNDSNYIYVQAGYASTLIQFALLDLEEQGRTHLAIVDFPAMLNSILKASGPEEVGTVSDALKMVQRAFPGVLTFL